MFRLIKSQIKVNRAIRTFNLMLKTDPYFHNRFRVKQVIRSYEEHVYYFIFRIYDRETKKHSDTQWVEDYTFEGNGKYFPRDPFRVFNNFIISRLHNLEKDIF
jgi:hypothetical protein